MHLYAEILPGSRIVYFYFTSTTKNELIYSHSILQQRTIWKYEILGLHPTDRFHQRYLDEYLEQKAD
ncbi:immunity protein YezG family protein [Paenibacillus sp. P3E]|uniref:immunity protein YezG family protein n=1 Tax=Paenibacillus sp. P3E TaxID=1349435 RepID=UPI0009FA3B0F